MHSRPWIVASIVAFGLTACDSESEEPPASVIGEPLHQALDRAESVQETLDARAAELRQRLEEPERN